MCTYLNGCLIAFTGTLPPVFDSEPELEKTMTASGEREPIGYPGDDNLARYGTRNKCSKYNRGRKAHDHIKHIRATKAALKRHIT